MKKSFMISEPLWLKHIQQMLLIKLLTEHFLFNLHFSLERKFKKSLNFKDKETKTTHIMLLRLISG